jgi:hypothetical protein
MKTHYFIKGGKLFLIPDMPEPSIAPHGTLQYLYETNEYQLALQRAKDNAIEVLDTDQLIEKKIYGTYGAVDGLPVNYYAWREDAEKNGIVFALEVHQVEVKWLTDNGLTEKDIGCRVSGYGSKGFTRQVALISPEVKEESQEELWNDVDQNYIRWNDQEIKLSNLIQNFELKRRK